MEITTYKKKFFITWIILTILTYNCYSQIQSKLFKDLNTEIKPTSLSKFNVINDSLGYFTSREYDYFQEDYNDTLEIYGTNGDSTFFVSRFNNGNVEFMNAETKLFFKYREPNTFNTPLYVINGNHSTLLTNVEVSSNDWFTYKGKIFFIRADVNSLTTMDLWVSNGTVAGTLNFHSFNNPNFTLSFLGASGNFVYVKLSYDNSNTVQIWKINYTNYQTSFVGNLQKRTYYSDKHPITQTNYFVFYDYQTLVIINNNTNQIQEIGNLKFSSNKTFLNNHYYFGLSNANYVPIGIHRLNLNNLTIELVNQDFKISNFDYIKDNFSYVSGEQQGDTYNQLYKSDTLFQNFTVVNLMQRPVGGEVLNTFYFNKNIYQIQRYSKTLGYYLYNERITRYNPITGVSEVILDSYNDGLHKSKFEKINFDYVFSTKKYFFLTYKEDRSSWGSQNPYINSNLWKSDGNIFNVFPTFGKNTLSSGVVGFNSDKNNIYFFADINKGYDLYTTDASLKNLKKYVDTTFVGDGLNIPNSKIYKAGNKLFFLLTHVTLGGGYLAYTDGTKAGTKFVKDINGSTIYAPSNFKVLGNYLYFSTSSQLWRTNGETTERIYNYFNEVKDFVIFNNSVYFIVQDVNYITTIWKRGENATNNQMIFQSGYVSYSSFPKFLGVLNNNIIFFTYENGCSIYSSDGTINGTNLIKNISVYYIEETIIFKNKIYFYDTSNPTNLWQTDGTANGTFSAYNGNRLRGKLVSTNDFLFFWDLVWLNGYFTFSPVIYNGSSSHFLLNTITLNDDYDYNNVFATTNNVFFRKNNITYVTGGLQSNTYFFSNESLSDVTVIGDFIFYVQNTKKYGKELWWIRDCKSMLSLNGIYLKDNIFSVSQEINSTQEVNNSNIIYRAGKSISLLPGFKTGSSTVFKAEVEGCQN